MPIPSPNLDDRTYADLLDEVRALIPSIYPEWTDHNPTDPGMTLVELFAWLTEMLIYRANRVPEASYRTFLKLLNGSATQLLNGPVRLPDDLDEATRATVTALRERYRAATADDFEYLAVHEWPRTSEAAGLGAAGIVARARCVPGFNFEATTATVAVAPGVAVDRRGRQIVLATAENVSLTAHLGQAAVLWISSRDEPTDPATTGSTDNTRWWEHPLIEAVREGQQPQGQDAVALGRATINAQGGVALDLGVRGNAGIRLPDGATGSVTLRTLAPNRADLTGSLSVRGHLTLEPGGSPNLYTGTGPAELNRYLQLGNSPDSGTASGLKAGGVLVSDAFNYANPPKNDLIVKGNVAIGTPTPENGGNWNKVLDILGAGHAKLSIRTAGIYGGAWVHDSAVWGAPAGMIAGTNTAHPISFVTSMLNRMTITAAGSVGIGSPTPAGRLTVKMAGGGWNDGLVIEKSDTTNRWQLSFDVGDRLLLGYNGAPRMSFIGGSGNVGIGVVDPQRDLQIGSDVTGIGLEPSDASPNAGYVRFGDNTGWKLHFGRSREAAGGALNAGPAGVLLTLQDNGNVGVGTTSPANRLHLHGSVADLALTFTNAANSAGRRGYRIAFDNDRLTFQRANDSGSYVANHLAIAQETGNVGIGTVTPNAPLQIVGGNWDVTSSEGDLKIGDDTFRLKIGVARGGGGAGDVRIRAQGGTSRLMLGSGTSDVVIIQGSDVTFGGRIGVFGQPATPRTTGWAGGIHTFDLEVEGTAWARHGWQSGHRDLAENYASETALEPGEVVCFDRERDVVVRSTDPNDTLICGVVSTAPGVLLNADDAVDAQQLFPIALCGRVPCKVVDENGPIRRGDLLTSSSTPGHAMRAEPGRLDGKAIYRAGTIVGKALEPLEAGTGLIEIFVAPG